MCREKKQQPLEWEEAKTLMRKVTDPHDKLQIYLGCYTGLRVGDIISLRWRDVLYREFITIKEGKTGKLRKISIHDDLKSTLNSVYEELKYPDQDSFLFISKRRNNRRKPITARAYNYRLANIFKEHGVSAESTSSHTLRKTWGLRVWENAGKTEEALIWLSLMFNHSSPKTTLLYLGLDRQIQNKMYMTI